VNYEFELPSGVYYLKYDTGIMSGYHSSFSRCHGISDDCPQPGVLVAVTVQSGKTVEGININDFYSNIEESLF
jgi:hypothetical protein